MINDNTKKTICAAIANRLPEFNMIADIKNDLREYIKNLSNEILNDEEKILIEKKPQLVRYQKSITLENYKIPEKLLKMADLDNSSDNQLHVRGWRIESSFLEKYRIKITIPFSEDEKIPLVIDDKNLFTEKYNEKLKLYLGEKYYNKTMEKFAYYIKINYSYINKLNKVLDFVDKNGTIQELKTVYPELYKLYQDEENRYN